MGEQKNENEEMVNVDPLLRQTVMQINCQSFFNLLQSGKTNNPLTFLDPSIFGGGVAATATRVGASKHFDFP